MPLAIRQSVEGPNFCLVATNFCQFSFVLTGPNGSPCPRKIPNKTVNRHWSSENAMRQAHEVAVAHYNSSQRRHYQTRTDMPNQGTFSKSGRKRKVLFQSRWRKTRWCCIYFETMCRESDVIDVIGMLLHKIDTILALTVFIGYSVACSVRIDDSIIHPSSSARSPLRFTLREWL